MKHHTLCEEKSTVKLVSMLHIYLYRNFMITFDLYSFNVVPFISMICIFCPLQKSYTIQCICKSVTQFKNEVEEFAISTKIDLYATAKIQIQETNNKQTTNIYHLYKITFQYDPNFNKWPYLRQF